MREMLESLAGRLADSQANLAAAQNNLTSFITSFAGTAVSE